MNGGKIGIGKDKIVTLKLCYIHKEINASNPFYIARG